MSKFFKALEKVDHERDAAAAPAPAPAPDAPGNGHGNGHSHGHGNGHTAHGVHDGNGGVAVVEAPPLAQTPAAPVFTKPDLRETAPAPDRSAGYGAPIARERGVSPFARPGGDMPDEVASEQGGLDDHLVSLLEPTSFAAEQYRAVRLAIETYRQERGTRVVGVSSPGRGDGKTITAINLAGALAQAPDARVVLVEVDLRHPAVTKYLGLPGNRGISGYLLDPTMSVDTVIQRPAGIAFAVVTAGAASSMPYELLKSPRLSSLFAALRERFDYVVVDTPPAMPFPDVSILRDAVDGFVLVVRANRTPREMLRDAAAVIGRNRGLGLIFNDDERTSLSFSDESEGGWRRYVPKQMGGSRVA